MNEPPDIDLQIFISRSDDLSSHQFEVLPSLPFVSARTNREASPAPAHQNEVSEESPIQQIQYTVVANSEVVETVNLPFTGEEIQKTIVDLDRSKLGMHACIDFGIRLFDFVFHRAVRDLYRDLLKRSEQEGRKLRVTVATSAPELAVLPWEIMCDSYPRLLPSFMCHSSHLLLARALRLFNRAEFKETPLGDGDEVRILVVMASPEEIAPIDVDMDGRLLQFILEREPSVKGVRLDFLPDATVVSLRRRLHEFRPHIVHIACHAGYDSQEDLGFVALVSARDGASVDRIHSYRLSTLLQESEDLQLVFVNSCLGAHQAASSALSGVAQCLHAMGIANVVALQFQLRDTTAHAIVVNFYDHLLRESRTVEGAVGELRRLMFLDGYLAPETFGITLFQTNTTLRWSRSYRTAKLVSSASGFRATFEEFEKDLEGRIAAELSLEPEILEWEVDDLSFYREKLSATYLTRMYEALGFWSLVLLLPRRFGEIIGISEQAARHDDVQGLLRWLMEHSAKLARRMSAARFEDKEFHTALAVMTETGLEKYKKLHSLDESLTSPMRDIFQMSPKAATKIALKVNGQNRAILVVVDTQRSKFRAVVQTLAEVDVDNDSAFPQATARWAALQNCLRVAAGWAFALPGSGRVKFLARGEQFTEYVSGQWASAYLRGLRREVVELAHELKLEKDLLVDVFDKCLWAAEQPKPIGKAIIIQRSDDVLELGVAKGFDSDLDQFQDLKQRPITDIRPDAFLQGAAGDRAVLISPDGYTIAVNAPLATSELVAEVDGAGERHRSAQEVTERTDAVAIVVSEDRPLTVFVGGRRRLTFPVSREAHAHGQQRDHGQAG